MHWRTPGRTQADIAAVKGLDTLSGLQQQRAILAHAARKARHARTTGQREFYRAILMHVPPLPIAPN